MFHLVYVSVAKERMSKEGLLDILAKSRKASAKTGITGMLLYKDGNFMQALEGEETAVRELYARISRDPRHLGVLTLVEGEREDRRFGDWSMGFQDLSSPEARARRGGEGDRLAPRPGPVLDHGTGPRYRRRARYRALAGLSHEGADG